jgi:hypothetical protein
MESRSEISFNRYPFSSHNPYTTSLVWLGLRDLAGLSHKKFVSRMRMKKINKHPGRERKASPKRMSTKGRIGSRYSISIGAE